MVLCPKPPRPKTTHHSLFKGVVVGFFSGGRLFICPIQTGTGVSEFIVLFSFFGNEVNADAVIAILVNDPLHRHVDLVDLEPRLVLELLPERSFPLSTCKRAEPTVTKAVHTLLVEGRLDLIELCAGLLVNIS